MTGSIAILLSALALVGQLNPRRQDAPGRGSEIHLALTRDAAADPRSLVVLSLEPEHAPRVQPAGFLLPDESSEDAQDARP